MNPGITPDKLNTLCNGNKKVKTKKCISDHTWTTSELQNCLYKNGDGALAEKTQLVSHLSKLNCLTVRGEFWTFVQGQVCSGTKCINWLPKVGTPPKIDLQRHKRFQTPISTSPEVTPPEYLLSSPKPSFHDVIREAIKASIGGTISRCVHCSLTVQGTL